MLFYGVLIVGDI